MKKLAVFIVALVAAASVHAGAVSWSVAGLTGNVGDVGALFVIGKNGVTSVSQITALVAAGTDVSGYKSGVLGTVPANGFLSITTAGSGLTLTYSGSGTDTYTAFAIVFNESTQGAATSYMVTATKTAAVANTTATQNFAFGNYSAGTWNSIVPEPTSMALLALGVAAMGLRRKFVK